MMLFAIGGLLAALIIYVLWVLVDGVITIIARHRIEAKRKLAKQAISLLVVSRVDHTESMFSLVLAHPNAKKLPAFQAGQYLTLLVPVDVGQKPVSRRYSLAQWQSKPTQYHLGIRQVEGGKASSWLHQHLHVGQRIDVLPPAGHFTLQDALADSSATDIVLIGAGIGITPIAAMLDTLAQGNKRVHLFHSAREASELIWQTQFSTLAQASQKLSYYPYLSKPLDAWHGRHGRIHVADILGTGIKTHSTHFFMCAKLEMMQEIERELIRNNVPSTHIHWESFGSTATNTDQQDYQVRIEGHGSYVFSGESSLLQAMESWRIPISADCRAGDCGECQIKVMHGVCKTAQPATCQTEPNKALACCVVPASDLTISL